MVTGDGITLGAGGLTATNTGPSFFAIWDVPLSLSASQTWSPQGQTTQLDIDQPIVGRSANLAINFGAGAQLVLESDDEVGPVTASGAGALRLDPNTYDSSQTAALNATDGNLITLSGGADLQADVSASVGPLSVPNGSVGIGDTSTGVLSVSGSASLPAGSGFNPVISSSAASTLKATGTVSLGGRLGFAFGSQTPVLYWIFSSCPAALPVGAHYTLIQSSQITGQFSNIPEGGSIQVECQTNNAVLGRIKVHYTSTTVTATVPAPPTNTSLPTVVGTTQDGQNLRATEGSWKSPDKLTFSFQWQRCNSTGTGCSVITGATSSAYRATNTDVGHELRVVVIATDQEGQSGQARTNATGPVTKPPAPTNKSRPVISGTPTSGQVLRTTTGSWTSPDKLVYTYQWERCSSTGTSCAAISGASTSAYKAASADVGHELTVVVTATDAEKQTGKASGAAVGPIKS
jgi:hypothetical protein